MKTSTRVRIIVGAAIVASLILTAGAYSVYAANSESTQKYPPVIEKLVTTFNLDRNKVDEVLNDYRQERESERKAFVEDKLDRLVKDGEITEKQKEAILKKVDELQGKFEELKNLSPEERREAMQKQRTDLEAWAKENDIDLTQVMFVFGGHKGFHKGFKRGFGGQMPGGRGFGPGCYTPPSDGSASSGDAAKSSLEL